MPSLHPIRYLPEQTRPALAGIKVAGGALDAKMKSARSFLLRGALQSANYAPVCDGRIFARSPIVGGTVESNGRGGNDDIAHLRLTNQAAARSHADKDTRTAADRFRQH